MLKEEIIDKKTVEHIWNQYNFGVLKKIVPIATSGNLLIVLQSRDDKKYLLRMSVPAGPRWRSVEDVLSEIELLDYLKTNGFPVVSALVNKESEKIISVDNRNGYLREYIEGAELEKVNINNIKKFGRLLGNLHKLTRNYHSKHKRMVSFNPRKIEDVFKEFKNKILGSSFVQNKKFVKLYEKHFSSLRFESVLPEGMLHEDLGIRHVLWKNNEIVAVIDFDRMYFGKLVWDVGQAIRGWCLLGTHVNSIETRIEKINALLTGYEEIRKITVEEKKCLFDAVKYAFLERSLSFCLRSILVTGDEDDASFAREALFFWIPLLDKEKPFYLK